MRHSRTNKFGLTLLSVLVIVGLVFVLWSPSGQFLEEDALEPGASPNAQTFEDGASTPDSERASRRELLMDLELAPLALQGLPTAAMPLAEGTAQTWRGQVVARTSGAGLFGAELTLSRTFASRSSLAPQDWQLQVVTDAIGRFEFEAPRQETIALEVRCEGYAHLYRPELGPLRELRLELDLAGHMKGVVTGPALAEAPGAPVTIWFTGGAERLQDSETEALIDSLGGFEFRNLLPGEYEVCVALPGWSLAIKHSVLVRSGKVTQVDLQPTHGATLRGRVTYTNTNDPVVRARIRVRPDVRGLSRVVEERGAQETRTDEEGRYEILGFSRGTVIVEAESESGSEARAEVSVASPMFDPVVEHDIELAAAGSVAGRVLLPSGQNAAHAIVQVAWENGVLSLDPKSSAREVRGLMRTTCDGNGRYRLEGLPGGRDLQLLALRSESASLLDSKPAQMTSFRSLMLKSAQELDGYDITLEETRNWRGVVRSSGGEPLEAVRVRLWHTGSPRSRSATRPQTTESDARGEFEIVGLWPGVYALECKREGYQSARQNFKVLKDHSLASPLEITMNSGHRIFGWVVNELGDAVPRARVRARRPMETDEGKAYVQEKSVSSDTFGRFEFFDLDAGSWQLSANATGYEASAETNFTLTDSIGAVRLELRSSDLVERSTVRGRVAGRDGAVPDKLEIDDLRGGMFEWDGGKFSISGLRAGRTSLLLRADGYMDKRTDAIDLPPGRELDIGFIELATAGRLDVFARDASNAPLSNFGAFLEPLTGSSKAKSRGRLKFNMRKAWHTFEGGSSSVHAAVARHEKVPLRTWRLVVWAKGYKPHRQEITFSEERPHLRVEVELTRL